MKALDEVLEYLWKWIADFLNIKEIALDISEIIWIIFIILLGVPLSIVGILALIQWIIDRKDKITKTFRKIKKKFKK